MLAPLVVAAVITAAAPFKIAPPDAWVQPVAVPVLPPAKHREHDVYLLLLDEQINRTLPRPQQYRHRAKLLSTAEGVANGSEVRIRFDPAYEKLTLHSIVIRRGDTLRDALRADQLKVIQEESELDRRIFNGEQQVIAFLEDVRPGDVVEWSYTTEGDNPAFAGHFGDTLAMGHFEPVGRIAARLLWPAARSLAIENHGTEVRSQATPLGEAIEHRWQLDDVPAVKHEDGTPTWYNALPWVQLSDFGSWAEVARWAESLHGSATPSSPMNELVARWKAQHPTPEAQFMAAVRFAQDDVRYLAMAIGAHGFVPHAPSLAFSRRFGDCKDKSWLLVNLLRALGFEAYPALVNTRRRRGIDSYLPTQLAFDHEIVKAVFDGKTHWIDATQSGQRGGLADLAPLRFERALVLDGRSTALERMPDAFEQVSRKKVVQTFSLPAVRNQAATLEVVSTYHGGDAEQWRQYLATQRVEYERQRLNFFSEWYPGIEVAEPLRAADVASAGALAITERYRLSDFWRGEEAPFPAWVITDELIRPKITRRKLPLHVDHPLEVEQEIRLNFATAAPLEAERYDIRGPAAKLTGGVEVIGKAAVVRYLYATTADVVLPEQIEAHQEMNRKILDATGFQLPEPQVAGMPSSRKPREASPWALGAAVCAFGALLMFISGLTPLAAYRSLRQRLRKRRYAANFDAKPGRMPATAILARGVSELTELSGKVKCSCGGKLRAGAPPQPAAAFLLGSRMIQPVDAVCVDCRTASRAYFELPRN